MQLKLFRLFLIINLAGAAFIQAQNKVYMSPDPAIVSWNTNTIQVTMQDYGSYPIGNEATPFYLEVNMGARSGRASVFFHIL